MALDKAGLVNLALSHVAGEYVQDIETEISNEAIHCRLMYNTALETCLREHDWKFASVFRPLVPRSGLEGGGWNYVYDYPGDAAALREILTYNQATDHPSVGFGSQFGSALGRESLVRGYYGDKQLYAIGNREGFGSDDKPVVLFEIGQDEATESLVIYTDVDEAVMRMTKKVLNPALYSPDFQVCFSWYLAHFVAYPLTRDKSIEKDCLVMARQTKGEAYSVNKQEATETYKEVPGSYIAARGGY
jgi:hypothetical protein